jgi:hypothetical protein
MPKKKDPLMSNLYAVLACETVSFARETFHVVASTVSAAEQKARPRLGRGWEVTSVNYLGEADSELLAFDQHS